MAFFFFVALLRFFLYYFLYFDKFEDLTHLGAKARPLFTYIIDVCVCVFAFIHHLQSRACGFIL